MGMRPRATEVPFVQKPKATGQHGLTWERPVCPPGDCVTVARLPHPVRSELHGSVRNLVSGRGGRIAAARLGAPPAPPWAVSGGGAGQFLGCGEDKEGTVG